MNAVSLKQPFLTRDGVIRLVLLVLLLGFGVWIARNTYWEDVAVPAQLRGEALRNQNYSIERLAALLGIHTHVLVSLDSLPARDGVLLLGEFNVRAPTPDQVQALEHWVERGGRLILPRYVLGSNPELQRWSGIKSVPMPKPAAGGADRQIVVRPPVTTLATRHRNDCPAMQVSADGTPTGESLVVCDLVIGDGFTSELRRGAEDHRQHRGAAAHCEDPLAPGACGAGAVSERAVAWGAGAAGAVQPAVNSRMSPDFIDR